MRKRSALGLIGTTAPAQILGRSAQAVHYWGKTRRLRSAGRSPMRFRVEDVVAFKDVLAAAPPERRGRPAGTTDIARIAREIVDTAGTPDVLWPSSGLTLQGFEVATDAG